MKVCVQITKNETEDPIQVALKAIVGQNPALQIVETLVEAELVVTNEPGVALVLLNSREDVKVLIVTPRKLLPFEDTAVGIQLLEMAYPSRVVTRPMVEREVEQDVVAYIRGL